MARRGGGLAPVPGFPFPVLASAGLEDRARRLAGRCAAAYRLLSETLASRPAITLEVLSRRDWRASVPYGMPHFDAGRLVLAGEQADFWRSFHPLVHEAPAPARDAAFDVYGADLDLAPFFDLLAVHELGHAFHDSARAPRRWLDETFANLCLHSYVAASEPDALPVLRTLPAVVTGVDPGRFPHRSLREFERLYRTLAKNRPLNYGWYQCHFHRMADQVHRTGGIGVLERLHALELPPGTPDAALAQALREYVGPDVAEVLLRWPTTDRAGGPEAARPAPADAPAATVTFLFTDIEGSTRLLQRLGERYKTVLDQHQAIVRRAVAEAGGTEVDTQGDSFFVAFPTASQAVLAAIAAQRALLGAPWPDGVELRVRMGLHTGEAVLTGGRYVGFDVHRAARIAAAGHGGQIVLSEATRGVVERRLPENVHVRNLGRHRLKDLPLPERVFQLVVPGLPVVFPPLRSLETQLTNLPVQVTSFVGRRKETDQARRLLRRTRLLTFTGPGGTGKTRLAVEVAGRVLSDYPDGVFFVPLATVGDPSLVPAAVAAAIGLPTSGGPAGPPAAKEAPVLESLQEYLAPRKLLLVLDNFEHLMAAAPVVESLLKAGPALKVLVTSRARLHVSGEQELPVAPLDTPDAKAPAGVGDLGRYDALALFEQRARAADPGLAVTEDTVAVMAKICARLDGLPLAIELAAARLNVLTPQLLLERLERALPLLTAGPRDAPARQRTLRDTVSWSHELLDPVDRVVFRRLSVFAGGCTLDAAEAVVGGGDVNVLDGISSLVAKSLVRRTAESGAGPRFRMLETIREYAYERLVESGEAPEVERRHARFYLDVVAGAEAQRWRAARPGSGAGAEWDLDNLRAALERCIRTGDAETGLGIASLMWRCWQQRGALEEGRRWTARLLALPAAADRTLWRARGLSASAGMAYWQGDYGEARAHYEEALSICRELDDRRGAAEALQSLAYLAGIRGDHAEAFALHGQSSAISRELGDLGSVAYDCVGEGMVHNVEGSFQEARDRFQEALALFEELGDHYGLASVLCLLSRLDAEQGDLAAAIDSWCRAFGLLRELGDSSGIIVALSDLCAIQLAAGRVEAAVRLAGAAEGLGRDLKVRPPALTRPLDPRAAAAAEIGDEAVQAAWDAGAAMTLEHVVDYALELVAGGGEAPPAPAGARQA